MADKAIGDLNYAPGTVDDNNTLFVVQQSGAAYKLDGHAFILALTTILDGHGGIASITYASPVSPSLDGTLTITLADGTEEELTITNGKGISSITDYWAVSSSNSSAPSTWYTTMQTMTTTNKYLWHYQHIAYNDNTSADTTKSVVGVYGNTGQAWYVWIKYAGTQPTQDSDMGDIPDNWIGIYSGTASSAPAHYTSYSWFEMKGDKGDQGDSISAVTKTSGTGAPGTTDVYTVYVDGSSVGTFNVYNGSDGQGSPGSQTPIPDSASGAVGSAVAYSREDHSHPINVATSGTPIMDGTASLGSAVTYARTDHIHPTDTSRATATAVLQSSVKTISSGGTKNYTGLTGLTSNHVVGNWGMFTDVDCTTPIPDNAPTCDITITTGSDGDGTWQAVIENFTSTFYLRPTFILKQN